MRKFGRPVWVLFGIGRGRGIRRGGEQDIHINEHTHVSKPWHSYRFIYLCTISNRFKRIAHVGRRRETEGVGWWQGPKYPPSKKIFARLADWNLPHEILLPLSPPPLSRRLPIASCSPERSALGVGSYLNSYTPAPRPC